jgi:hypothetical protein
MMRASGDEDRDTLDPDIDETLELDEYDEYDEDDDEEEEEDDDEPAPDEEEDDALESEDSI